MKVFTNRFIRYVLFLVLLSCVLWVMNYVLSLHTFPLSSFQVPSQRQPHHLSTLTQEPLTNKIHNPYSTLTFSTNSSAEPENLGQSPTNKDVERYFTHKKISRIAADLKDVNDLGVSAHRNHSLRRKLELHTFSINAEKIVSKLKMLQSKPYLAPNASFFVPRNTVVNHFANPWLIQTTCPSESLSLLVVVPSMHSHTARREAIRNTWGSPAYGHVWPAASPSWNSSVQIIFFLGVSNNFNQTKILSEAEAFRDVVVSDFVDSYRNLSLKMAVVLKWVDLYCAHAQYVLKVDEDTFINVPLLLHVLALFSATHSRFILGHKRGNPKPSVARTGRWAVSLDAYPHPYWPSYIYGHSYVISGDAIKSLRHASQHLPLITNEDAYLTGVLAKSAGIQLVHSAHFAVNKKVHFRCNLVTNLDISQTGVTTSSSLYALWHAFETGNCSGVTH